MLWPPLLVAAPLAAPAQQLQERPGSGIHGSDATQGYYREPRSYGAARERQPARYVRPLSELGIDFLQDVEWLQELDVGLDHRLRFESRDDDARRSQPGLDMPLLLRTRAYLGFFDPETPLHFGVEIEDARRENSGFPRDDRDVNEFEAIQAYLGLHWQRAFGSDPLGNDRPLTVRFGRMWFELLDRRLIANNQWRNTTNTFQGFYASIGQENNDWQIEWLAVQPLQRLSADRQRDAVDRTRAGQWLFGAIGHWRSWSDFITLEPYFLSLQQDSRPNEVRRAIHSAALRAYGIIGASGFDYDTDAVFQFGRNSGENHRAFGLAGELGYTWMGHPWKPRLSGFYGYATGDGDPNDGRSERFERYFGFGRPWSANDYMTWENISTPKTRLEFQPNQKLRIDTGCGFYWLASATDRWANANRRDPSGRSGRFVGHEFDVRARFNLSARIEAALGYAHFEPGGFARRTGARNDSDFVYLEVSINAFR